MSKFLAPDVLEIFSHPSAALLSFGAGFFILSKIHASVSDWHIQAVASDACTQTETLQSVSLSVTPFLSPVTQHLEGKLSLSRLCHKREKKKLI